MIGRLRTLVHIDSASCLVGGAVVTAFAGPVADGVGINSTVAVRSVGVFLVGCGIVLALLARANAQTVELAARLTAVTDASRLLATVALIGTDAYSSGGNVVTAMATIPAAALGVGKAARCDHRRPPPSAGSCTRNYMPLRID
jgi:hypothetical protein